MIVVLAVLCASWLSPLPGARSTSVALAATSDPVLAVGGDIACPPGKAVTATKCGQGKTGALLASINPNYVLPLGDSQYDTGSAAEYAGSYDVTGWGAAKTISRPAAGNHEYRTTGATGYYGYFGANAGDPSKGYYSWDVAGPNNSFRWHLIALNSECDVLGGGSITAGCGAGSTQEAWLKADLAANQNVCTIAYWHRPRFSSSTTTPSTTTYTAFWNDLYNAGADIVLNGHAHDYERFNPQTGAGVADPARGIREFVVGSGGEDFQTLGAPIANSAIANASAFGVMTLTLHANTYDWQFVAAAGYTLSDAGSGTCHAAPVIDSTPPSAPTNVSGSAGSANQVGLSWNASTDNVGVTNYTIYRGSNGATPSLLATTTTNATSYTDTSVIASTTYTYSVQAGDAAGNKSAMSAPATVTTPASTDTTPPTAPSGLVAEAVFYNEIDLGWTASTDSGTGVSGYRVYRRGPGESSFTLLATTAGTGAGHSSYADLTVKPGSAYSYYVTAYDGGNNVSSASNTATAPTPPGPISHTYSFNSTGDATIQQANPTATGGGASPLVIDNSPISDALLKFNVAGTSCDTLASAKLTLTNNANGSVKGGDFYTTGPFDESTVSWSTAPTRGTLLNSLAAVAANASVSVDVTQGTPLNGEADFRIASTSSDGVHYFSREGTGGKPTLTVVCTEAQVPDNTPPSTPANLRSTSSTSGEVALAWDASTDNLSVSEYHIYRDGAQIGIVPASSLSYQDTTVAPSTSYSYTARAFDTAGNSSGDSNAVSVTTPAVQAAPAAPSGLTATVSGSSVTLSWTASTSPSVSGYNIYRGPQGGALVKINSSGSSPFTDTPVGAGTYDYAVTAVATGSPESARSAIATATVQATEVAAPTGLTATATSATSVQLSWTASETSGVTSYNIYRGPHSGTLDKISSTTTTAANDTTVAASTAYDYAVTAVTSTAESPRSAVVTVTTPASGGSGSGISAGTAKVTQVTTATAPWTVDLPAFTAGDFMVIWLGNNLGSTAGTPASTGWTSQLMTNESSGLKGSFLTRRMAAGDPTSITVTYAGATLGVAAATAFTGVNATAPVEARGGQAEASTTAVASHSTPTVTTTTANDVLVAGFTTDKAATWTASGTELADAVAGALSASMYYIGPVAAGAQTATGTATVASIKAVSGLLALRP